MQLEVGKILEGKVTGITKFGAFIDLGGTTGMVHISEVAPTYVKEISDHLKEGETVKVKVLKIGEDGKISLSIKQAMDNVSPRRPQGKRPPYDRDSRQIPNPAPKTPEASFEEMMSKFKQASEEKMSDLKRIMDGKHGSYSKRSPRS
ncbi:MAG TPA: S1 RNA-binding domain-containing protein [Firmicutes bacterium]|nr:S1 RNA-binding domain-containing protein [Bacillota bacterium]